MDLHGVRMNWKNKRYDRNWKKKTERADRGGRQAYHLCVGGHKLKKKNKRGRRRSKIKSEEAEKKRGGRKEKRIRTKGKMNFRMFKLKNKEKQKQKKNRTKGNQKQLTWSKITVQRKMLLCCRYEWSSNVLGYINFPGTEPDKTPPQCQVAAPKKNKKKKTPRKSIRWRWVRVHGDFVKHPPTDALDAKPNVILLFCLFLFFIKQI